ncbi:EAL domain-containing protein (putative c-di-GMP-specific phosphodiesterase class I) [Brevibacterium sanguinis]|uniref:EAL domain-containing protein (Putative c-di-GMP-specific phosphodiesterase class I) n=3 Tax=Brevibacteriaceae TaxID=85019 RepID=A0A366IKN6_9MICO|nr:EAL domain-containing protein (putative c-di-GMP-specific phosphodiesterase class I) [Brevibacterium sanguinis]RBP71534.1 EAL domain-containing protein (putative c-di-GMP-specific phosphodiesterase class I) [Brevibacterium celere]
MTETMNEQRLDLEELVRSGGIETYFAPVVDSLTFDKVGYQIFQAPVGDPALGHAESENLRRAMHSSELIGDIDASLRDTAIRTAEAAGLPNSNRLFIRAEEESFATLEDRTAEPDRSVILQLDASRVSSSPASVLRSVRQARSMGWGVGMSAVGADLRSASFVPLVNPSVVGLHPDVLRIDCDSHLAELNRLLHAHLERTNAVILAEGVSSEADLDRVRALGARYMSGPYFGRSTRSPEPFEQPIEDALADHHSRNLPATGTPYSIAQGLHREPLVMNWELLLKQIAALEERALASGAATIALGVFGEDETFSQATHERYERIRDTVGLTAMFSGGFTIPPVPGVRGGIADASDPIRNEHGVVVVGPDWSGLVAASKRNGPGSDGQTMYDVYITTERYTCVDAARSVLTRIMPAVDE